MNKNIIQETTLVDLLRYRAKNQANKIAYTFLVDGDTEEISFTYAQLDQRVRTIAAKLQDRVAIGDRALLLYPPGLDYIAAFFACLYAGVIAVPTYPPRRKRIDPRMLAIVADAEASVVLTTSSIFSDMEQRIAHVPKLKNLHWIVTDNLIDDHASAWQEPVIYKDSLAFLQYTSGSTGMPKGVMVSHGNLLHNSEYIKKKTELTENSVSFTWLPSFHDMGLINGLILPVYMGFHSVFMSPLSFILQPILWFQAISRYKVTYSGGPNSAYELCISKIIPEQLENIDLSSWCIAFNGSEPIRRETLERFVQAFKHCGFQASFFYPCYGLAEHTVAVSGGFIKDEPVYYYMVETKAFQKVIIGCGKSGIDTKIIIVDPNKQVLCEPEQVGEIWVSGPSVAQGYWHKPIETEQTFHAYIADSNDGPFLRTGDLGFLQDGELFVTGRLKDLIIIRGRNYYPQDIEFTVEHCHPRLQYGNSAAFSVNVNGEERLVIAAEVERRYGPSNKRRLGLDRRSGLETRQVNNVSSFKPKFSKNFNVEETINNIIQAVSEQHELAVYAVLLLRMASIPKTSSGKIQRHACRNGFLAGSGLNIMGEWRENLEITSEQLDSKEDIKQKLENASDNQYDQILTNFLQTELAYVLKLTSSKIEVQQPLNLMGFDSLKTVELINLLKNKLDVYIPIEKLMEGINIIELVTYIKSKTQASDSSIDWEEIDV